MFKKLFALSDQGARDLTKGAVSSFFANLALMLPVGLLFVVMTHLLAPITGGVESFPAVVQLTVAAAIAVILIYLTSAIQYKHTYVAAYSESANRRISVAEKLRQLPLSFFGRRDLSDLTTTIMSDCTELEHTFSHAIPQLIGTCASLLLVGIGLFIYEWRLALSVMAALPVSLLLVIGSKKLQEKFGTRKVMARLAAADGIQECLETVKDLKACGQAEKYLASLDRKLAAVVRASMVSESVTGAFLSSSVVVLKTSFAVVILVGASLLVRGEVDVITYIAFLLASSRLYDPLITVFMHTAEIFNAQIQIKRMKVMENEPVQTGAHECDPQGYDIVFENVTFSYNKEIVLHDVSFMARQGEVTALIGPSGSGKSTATKLAARFWDPDSGRITLGGKDVTHSEPEALLKNFAIVFQDVVLFNDSIMENIRLGRRGASNEEVYQAARLAQCDHFISRFPEGYGTVIGENGATLSGGERQRISIARALLKDAPVILLDEATASLDVENETLIQQALSTLVKDKTVLVIAHRMRTIAGADKIVVLQEGKVVEMGSPAELSAREGLYRHLSDIQNRVGQWKL